MGLTRSPWRMSAIGFTLFIAMTIRSPTSQPPVPPSQQRRATELNLSAGEEKDSYEIYSMLLRTEMPPEWKVTAWAINQETQTFPVYAASYSDHFRRCLQEDQDSTYLTAIQDYAAKNKKRFVLERKFSLPQYELIGPRTNAPLIFTVSAVGFDPERTRAVVYVGHNCGGLCGGGQYHFLAKTNEQWRVDHEHGSPCSWVS